MSPVSQERNARTELLIGAEAVERLSRLRIAVFGVGGVGGGVIEALARCNVGAIDVIDGDCVTEGNLNRQMIATVETLGMRKVTAAAERIRAVNPDCIVREHDVFVTADNAVDFDFSKYDYVVDAIDNVTAKIAIAKACSNAAIPHIMCLGTGNKLDPLRLQIGKLSETQVCPLARAMRRELKELSGQIQVLWSDEQPLTNARPPGSVPFVPPVAGMMIAGYVIRRLLEL